MQVKVKKLNENAVIPSYAHSSDAGLDLTATSIHHDYECVIFGTGLAFEIPDGYVGLLFPRSSNRKTDLYLTNSIGVIDSGYRGEVMLSYKDRDFSEVPLDYYEIGDKVGQLIIIPYPKIELIEAKELSISDRGEGGFGSTGK